MPGTAQITVRSHWACTWWARTTAHPWVVVDGQEHAVSWSKAFSVELPPGKHEIAAGMRYLNDRAMLLGLSPVVIEVQEGQVVRLRARNSLRNGMPFRIQQLER